MTTPHHNGPIGPIASKVALPSAVGVVIGGLFGLASLAGINPPFTPEDASDAVWAAMVLATFGTTGIKFIIGYFAAENSPPPSAIATLEQRGTHVAVSDLLAVVNSEHRQAINTAVINAQENALRRHQLPSRPRH